jgi:hypothetical protein
MAGDLMAPKRPEGGWGLNVGAFIAAYPGWAIGGTARGWTAQRRNARGCYGPVLEAGTLAELDALIEEAGPDPAGVTDEPSA